MRSARRFLCTSGTRTAFDPVAIRQHALYFDRPEFKTRITTFLADKMGIAIA